MKLRRGENNFCLFNNLIDDNSVSFQDLHKISQKLFYFVFFCKQELDLPFLKIAATEIVSGVSGESEEKVREMFDQAVVCKFMSGTLSLCTLMINIV